MYYTQICFSIASVNSHSLTFRGPPAVVSSQPRLSLSKE